MNNRRGATNSFILVAVLLAFIVGGYFLLARPEAKRVHVTIKSDPKGSAVYIDGLSKGYTPLDLTFTPGQEVNYRLEAAEPYNAYHLYKAYTGSLKADKDKAISVWIPRTTAAEQASEKAAYEEKQKKAQEAAAERQRQQKAAAAEGRRQQKEAAARAEAARQKALEARKLYYRIETNCASGVDITYSNANGDSTQQSNVGNSWNYWFYPQSGQFIYLSAQNQCGSGYVTVKLVKDGVTVRENTSSGGYVIATVSGRW